MTVVASESMTTAVVTASYAPDFERCRLLCESMDRHVSGYTCHYILVESADVALFKALEGPRRVVIDERDLLPWWLKAFPDPLSLGRRRIWLSPFTMPMRGWHSQQLRRMAIAATSPEDGFFYCDSDVVFVRDFDVASLWKGNDLRLFRRDDAMAGPSVSDEHRIWVANAAWLLETPPELIPEHDYIGTLIAWRGDTVRGLIKRIEDKQGKNWIAAIGRRRRFSECTIYGQYADALMGQAGHFVDNQDLCEVFWFKPMPTEQEFLQRVASMKPEQVAIGIQSFIGVDIASIRRLIGKAAF